jgi:tetratricopeptide (TPR) repeat protein
MKIKEIIGQIKLAIEKENNSNGKLSAGELLADYKLISNLYDTLISLGEDFNRHDFFKLESDISIWILDIPYLLAKNNMVDEAVDICRKFSQYYEKNNFLGDLSLILGQSGRKEEAISQIQENLKLFPDDVWIIIKAGDAYNALNETENALELYYKAYDMTTPRSIDRSDVLERLIPLLERLEKDNEADGLKKIETEAKVEHQMKPIPQPIINKKKIGRNEPCPCGSGKKYKKCCVDK